MTRTIITTCGTSLLKSSCWNLERLNEKHLSQMRDEEERRKHELKCMYILSEAKEDKADISKKFDRFSWDNLLYLRDLPAELASLRAIQIYFESRLSETKKPLGTGDKIILLHSDNDEGRFCGNMLYNILSNSNFFPGVKIDTPWEVKGLDPRDSADFGNALLSIWRKIIKINGTDTKYIFNLTGGYKGISIMFGGVAYHLSNVPIFYLHEETNFEQIFIMGFNKKEEDMEKWFSVGSFNILERKTKPSFGSYDPFGI